MTLTATDSSLAVRAEASSEQNLRRIEEMTTGRLLKFSRRHEHLDIQWNPGPDTLNKALEAG